MDRNRYKYLYLKKLRQLLAINGMMLLFILTMMYNTWDACTK